MRFALLLGAVLLAAAPAAAQGVVPTIPTSPGQYNSTLPTLASGATGYLAVDSNSRLLLAPGSAVNADLRIGGAAASIANPVPVNIVSGGGSGGGATGSVTAPGTSGTQAQAVQGITNGVPLLVSGTFFQATQPVSASALPLPAGAATSANQASEISALGTTGDSAYAGSGAASIVGALKGVYNATLAPLVAGANYIGQFGPAATTTAVGPTPATSTGSGLVAKASAGNLYGFSVTAGGTATYLAILNATATPAGGAAIAPLECVPVPINGYVARRQDIPDRYTAGIVMVSTSSCATFTAVTPQLITAVVQ